MNKKEIYKDVVGYEGLYKVSNLGYIYSTGFENFRKLKPTINIDGYIRVGLSKNKKVKTFLIHQIVAIAFLNHKPSEKKFIIDHLNGIKHDNKVDNLELVTYKENTRRWIFNKSILKTTNL